MNHIPLNVTDVQRANLVTLAAYMETFQTSPERVFNMCAVRETRECGTAGCAYGWGLDVVPPLPSEFRYGSNDLEYVLFTEYRHRAYGRCNFLYAWCFSGGWCDVDNTPAGAAARIRYALAHGIPENYSEQMLGSAPLCYSVTP